MKEFEQLFNLNPQVYNPVFHSNTADAVLSPVSERNIDLHQPDWSCIPGNEYVEIEIPPGIPYFFVTCILII